MRDLIQQCKSELKRTRQMKEAAPDYEQKIFSSMITDLEVAIAWMETGRPPGSIKGVYGQYISSAIPLEPKNFEYGRMRNIDGTIPLDPFEEVGNQIDKEREARKRA